MKIKQWTKEILKPCKFICLNIGKFQAVFSEFFDNPREKKIVCDNNTFKNYFILLKQVNLGDVFIRQKEKLGQIQNKPKFI